MKTKKRNLRTLAEAAEYTPAMLSHIVNGIRSPGLAGALKLKQITGISVETWASRNQARIAAAVSRWKRDGKQRSSNS